MELSAKTGLYSSLEALTGRTLKPQPRKPGRKPLSKLSLDYQREDFLLKDKGRFGLLSQSSK